MEAWDWLRAMAALAATLSLALLAAWGARRYNLTPRLTQGAPDRRLRVLESLSLDARRRLVLIRLDDSEHLLLLSASGDLTVSRQAIAEVRP